jgi:hypothetical protein
LTAPNLARTIPAATNTGSLCRQQGEIAKETAVVPEGQPISPVWEYLILPEAERERLHDLGREGWELVAAGGDPADRQLYLKRPGQGLRERVTLEQRAHYFATIGQEEVDRPEDGA